MTPPAPLLSVVVPTRNEAGNIPPLWERLTAALDGVPFEVCFVDDSDDATPAVLERLAAAHPGRARCLLRAGPERAGGLSTAVVAGLRMCRGRHACVMDGDLQHPPELIPAMLSAAEEGTDLVVASRYGAGATRGGLGIGRRTVSRAARLVTRLLFSEARRSSDPLSGFFLCRRDVLQGIEFRPVGFKILLELLVLAPDLTVRDVPLAFQARGAGRSKATAAQGLLFLRHLRSLVFEVRGSARLLKFALVGMSGLLIFLPLLGLLAGPAGLPPLAAFVPAFFLSVAWNTSLNRLWTFADRRRRAGGEGPRRYLQGSLLSGVIMLGSFALLLGAHVAVLAAGGLSALVGMVVNGLANLPTVGRPPVAWARLAGDRGVQAGLSRLAADIGADRALIVPAGRPLPLPGLPPQLASRVSSERRPAMWTEAPSPLPQRRTNIDLRSVILVPFLARDLAGIIVCERRSPHAFGADALDTALRATQGLAETLALMADPMSGDRSVELETAGADT